MNFENTFVASDHHFGHANILKFFSMDGKTRVRPEFDNVDDMNHEMIRRHNSVVKDDSKVYFLGDVTFNLKLFHEVMPQLKGRKSLILGNHDDFSMAEYMKYFKSIRSSKYIKYNENLKLMLCHYPVHMNCNHPNHPVCIHGHIHEKDIMIDLQEKVDPNYQLSKLEVLDTNYFNVSVEKINYTPISIAEIARRLGYEKETQKTT